MEHLDGLKAKLARKDVFVFLDYDGTLTPIVATPDLAILSEDMRGVIRELASRFKVSIVSGRATDDVREKVKVNNIYYAGSHGFEIIDPAGQLKVNEEARALRPVIDEIHRQLSERLKEVQGALVEHVKYTVSVHYRLVSDNDFPKVEKAVDAVLRARPQLRKTSGKKVFELRPNLDWHKGKAVEWILNVLGYDRAKHAALYIGDDVTDEDAFLALKDNGFGVLVSDGPRPSHADYRIADVQEVKQVLEYLIRIKS